MTGHLPFDGTKYPIHKRRPLGEWWKNHIFVQVIEEHTNVALLHNPLTLYDAMRCGDAMKWEIAIQKEYKFLVNYAIWKLTLVPPTC
jgi:hypothetical protein